MKHPQSRRGKRQDKIKTSTKKTTKKTPREEDKTMAPAAPAPEGERPAPSASTPEEASREDGWKTAKEQQTASAIPGHQPARYQARQET